MKEIKILLTGNVQENFNNRMVTGIKANSSDKFIFSVLNDFNAKIDDYREINNFIPYSVAIKPVLCLIAFFKICISRNFISEYFLDIRVRGLKYFFKYFKDRIKAYLFAEKINKSDFDIIHHFYIYRNDFIISPNLKKKVICSVYGSDLYRQAGVYSYYYNLKLLNRADSISIHSVEMREVMLAKFGRHLLEKTNISLFPLNVELLNKIKTKTNVEAENLNKCKYNNQKRSLNVIVGHNAKRENNQLLIIKKLAKLPPLLKDKIIFTFILTYSGNDRLEYANEIKRACETNNLKHQILTDYLLNDGIATLLLSTDIVLHLLISDALSHFVTEALYAGCILITGSWLPYGTFRRAGLEFKDIENIDDLTPLLTKIINDGIEKHRPNIEKQQLAIERKFFPEQTSKMWIEIYEKLLSENK